MLTVRFSHPRAPILGAISQTVKQVGLEIFQP